MTMLATEMYFNLLKWSLYIFHQSLHWSKKCLTDSEGTLPKQRKHQPIILNLVNRQTCPKSDTQTSLCLHYGALKCCKRTSPNITLPCSKACTNLPTWAFCGAFSISGASQKDLAKFGKIHPNLVQFVLGKSHHQASVPFLKASNQQKPANNPEIGSVVLIPHEVPPIKGTGKSVHVRCWKINVHMQSAMNN